MVQFPSIYLHELLLFLADLLLGTRKMHLGVKFESNEILDLQIELVVVHLLLVASLGLQFQGNLQLVLYSIDVVLLYY